MTDNICSICYEEYEYDTNGMFKNVEFLPCCHKFHRECIRPWIRDNSVCPLCKISIHTQNPINSEDAANPEDIDNNATLLELSDVLAGIANILGYGRGRSAARLENMNEPHEPLNEPIEPLNEPVEPMSIPNDNIFINMNDPNDRIGILNINGNIIHIQLPRSD